MIQNTFSNLILCAGGSILIGLGGAFAVRGNEAWTAFTVGAGIFCILMSMMNFEGDGE